MVLNVTPQYMTCGHIHESGFQNGGNTGDVSEIVASCVARKLGENLLCAHASLGNPIGLLASQEKVGNSIRGLKSIGINITDVEEKWKYIRDMIGQLDSFSRSSYGRLPSRSFSTTYRHQQEILTFLEEIEVILGRCGRICDDFFNIPQENDEQTGVRDLNPGERTRFHFLIVSCQNALIPMIEEVISEIKRMEGETETKKETI